MSSAAMKWVRRQVIPDGAVKAVLMELASVSRDGINAWPSQATISSSTGLSKRTVWQALRVLAELGLIRRTRRSRGRLGRSSDVVTLNVHREFELSRTDIADAKHDIHQMPGVGVADRLQLANPALATRKRCERIKRDKHLPIQKGRQTTSQALALGGEGRPRLRLVAGTAVAAVAAAVINPADPTGGEDAA